jgi:hypothetical protein
MSCLGYVAQIGEIRKVTEFSGWNPAEEIARDTRHEWKNTKSMA